MKILAAGILMLLGGGAMQLGTQEMRVTGLVVLMFAAGVIALGVLRRLRRAPRAQLALCFGMSAAATLLVISMATISGSSVTDWKRAEQADWAIVLGCYVNGETPSRTLRERLDLTLELMERSPEIRVIVSGARGGDEGIEEGTAMYRYLEAHGADMTRVTAETQAHNTRENLRFSMQIIDGQGGMGRGVMLVTSDFHVMRAKWIAATMGIEVEGLGSKTTPWWSRQCDLCREVPAFGKAIAAAAIGGGVE